MVNYMGMSINAKPAPKTPTITPDGSQSLAKGSGDVPSSAALALSMSWQLLVVVLLPIMGGHILDVRFKSSPIFMILGIVFGLIGSMVVVTFTVRQMNEVMNQPKGKD